MTGGPSAELGGNSIVANGRALVGTEGNGVIQFNGTVQAISLSLQRPELNQIGAVFTVGVPAAAAVPEPTSLSLLSVALLLMGAYRARLKNQLQRRLTP